MIQFGVGRSMRSITSTGMSARRVSNFSPSCSWTAVNTEAVDESCSSWGTRSSMSNSPDNPVSSTTMGPANRDRPNVIWDMGTAVERVATYVPSITPGRTNGSAKVAPHSLTDGAALLSSSFRLSASEFLDVTPRISRAEPLSSPIILMPQGGTK